MSRVVVATAFGGPEVLSVIDQPVADPGPGQVLIDVRAAGVNPIDHKQYSGLFGTDPARLPMRIGSEVAGVVRAAGVDAVGALGPIAVGDEVIAYRVAGGYADALIANAADVFPKPASISWEEAAGLMLTGATAIHALTATSVGSGDTLLLHGASGGVGLMTVELAIARGARVIGTARPERHDALRALGAEPVAYGDGLTDRVRALAPDGVDAAIDAAGTDEALDVSVELGADRARIATIAGFARGAQLGVRVLGGAPGADPGTEIRSAARAELVRLAGEGRVHVAVAATYPLEDVAEAMRASADGHSPGKIVLVTGHLG